MKMTQKQMSQAATLHAIFEEGNAHLKAHRAKLTHVNLALSMKMNEIGDAIERLEAYGKDAQMNPSTVHLQKIAHRVMTDHVIGGIDMLIEFHSLILVNFDGSFAIKNDFKQSVDECIRKARTKANIYRRRFDAFLTFPSS